MTQPAELDQSSPGSTALSYSPALRRAFYLPALAVALLPIPVGVLHLLPAYRIHNLFLVFYAPLLCLITLGYLFYIRDSFARAMFRHLLSPVQRVRLLPRDNRSSTATHVGDGAERVPGALRYMSRLNESVAAAGASSAERLVVPEDVGLPSDSGAERGGEPTRVSAGTRRPSSETMDRSTRVDSTVVGTAAPLADSAVLRQRALEDAAPGDVPHFAELTMFSTSDRSSPLCWRFVLMGLREYAKETLGLSERDVVLGRILVDPE